MSKQLYVLDGYRDSKWYVEVCALKCRFGWHAYGKWGREERITDFKWERTRLVQRRFCLRCNKQSTRGTQ